MECLGLCEPRFPANPTRLASYIYAKRRGIQRESIAFTPLTRKFSFFTISEPHIRMYIALGKLFAANHDLLG